MKTFAILMLLISSFSLVFAQHEKKLSLGEQPVFKVSKTNEAITIDGKLNEGAWQKTESRSLNYFYKVENESDQQNTFFRMLWDEENLYLFFACEDQ